MTIAEFILARVAEDEAVARGSLDNGEGCWHWTDPFTKVKQALVDERGRMVLPSALGDVYPSASVATHITRYDPARVLRQCEAIRRVVEEHYYMAGHDSRDFGFENGNCLACRKQGPCATLRELAAIWSDHPDYRQEWGATYQDQPREH